MNAVLLILLRWNHERSAADTAEGTMNAVLLILLRGRHERSAADTAEGAS